MSLTFNLVLLRATLLLLIVAYITILRLNMHSNIQLAFLINIKTVPSSHRSISLRAMSILEDQ